MPEQTFEATVETQPGYAIIEMRGEINAFAEKGLNLACKTALDSKPGAIALDFGRVSYINSTGIALLVQLLANARKAQRRVLGFGLSDHYHEIFRITRLSDFIELYPNQDEALAVRE